MLCDRCGQPAAGQIMEGSLDPYANLLQAAGQVLYGPTLSCRACFELYRRTYPDDVTCTLAPLPS